MMDERYRVKSSTLIPFGNSRVAALWEPLPKSTLILLSHLRHEISCRVRIYTASHRYTANMSSQVVRIPRFKNLPPFRHCRGLQSHV
jgi:hypothetical protein